MNKTAVNILVQLFIKIYVFISLGAELLGPRITLCIPFWWTVKLFQGSYAILYLNHKGSNFPTSPGTCTIFHFFIMVLLVGGISIWYLIVTLICISLMINDIEHWLFTYPLWRNVWSNPLWILPWAIFLCTCKTSSIINNPYQGSTFVTTDEPISTQHNHPSPHLHKLGSSWHLHRWAFTEHLSLVSPEN